MRELSSFLLRPFEVGDETWIMAMYDEPHVARMLARPNRDKIAPSVANRESELQLVWLGDEAVGLILLAHELPWLYCIRQLVANCERQGIGSFAMRWALHPIFEEDRAHRAYLDVKARNVSARLFYEQFGFVHEGRQRDAAVDPLTGTFEDLCIYGLLEDEYWARKQRQREY